jgi:hypothetical protein
VILEVSAIKKDGTSIFKEEREYKNVGLSRKGESVAAAWLISSYSEEKSTAFKFEVRKKPLKCLYRRIGSEFHIYARSIHTTVFLQSLVNLDKVLVLQLSER